MDNSTLSHTRWTCKYHIVFAPKYRRKVIYALAKYNQSNPIKVYGDNTITSKDKAVIRRMAAYIGVSYTALVIRLRDMGLFEY